MPPSEGQTTYEFLDSSKSAEEYLTRLNETTPGGLINKRQFDQELATIKSTYGPNLSTIVDFYALLYDACYGWMEATNVLSKFPDFPERFWSFEIVDREHTLLLPDQFIEFTEQFRFRAQTSWPKTVQALKALEGAELFLTETANPAAEELEVASTDTVRLGKFFLGGLITAEHPANSSLLEVARARTEQFLADNGLEFDDLDRLRETLGRRHSLTKEFFS